MTLNKSEFDPGGPATGGCLQQPTLQHCTVRRWSICGCGGSSGREDWPQGIFGSTSELFNWKKVKVAQWYLTLCNPMDCSLPACSVHGISQARILEWVAVSFSRGFPDSGQTQVSCTGRQVLYHWAFTGNLTMTGWFKSIYWSSHLADAIISAKKRTNNYSTSLHP